VKRGLPILLLLLACASSLAWAGGTGVPSTGVNQAKTPELKKTIPITKKGEPRTVVHLDADDLGAVGEGDLIEAFTEVEVSVTCLEPVPKCVGTLYRYSPKVEASLVLTDGLGRSGTQLGSASRITCAQDLPNRNHHCILSFRRTQVLREVPACAPLCSVNLVMKAFHPNAARGNVLVIGADRDSGIAQRRATLSAAVFEPDQSYAPVETKTTERMVRTIDVDPDDTLEKTVASIRLDRLTRGEVLAVEARAVTSVGHLPYNVLTQGQVVMSERRASSDHHGIPLSVSTRNGQVTAKNGFNCTQGKSEYETPCTTEEGAFVRILANARKHPNQDEGPWVPLYLNFFMGFQQEYAIGRTWRPGDEAKIRRVRLEVRRYTPKP
jgi:hypothetical protein